MNIQFLTGTQNALFKLVESNTLATTQGAWFRKIYIKLIHNTILRPEVKSGAKPSELIIHY